MCADCEPHTQENEGAEKCTVIEELKKWDKETYYLCYEYDSFDNLDDYDFMMGTAMIIMLILEMK